MEAAGREGIPREEVANSQFGVPISASPQAAVGARSTLTASLREDYRCLPPPIGSTIMKTLQEASDRITPGGAGGVAERDGHSIGDGHSIAMKEGPAELGEKGYF